MENKKLSTNKILGQIYSWLCQPHNRCVEDWHYAMCEKIGAVFMPDLESSKGRYKAMQACRYYLQENFIKPRLLQAGIEVKPEQLKDITYKYFYNMYH